MMIMVHVLCPAVHGGGWDPNLSIGSPYNKSFLLCHFPIQYMHLHTSSNSVTYFLHTFSQQQCLLPSYSPCTLFHIPPATLQPLTYHRSLSNSPHIIIKCSTSSPALLSHYTPLIYNRFTSLLVLQQPTYASPQSEQQPPTS